MNNNRKIEKLIIDLIKAEAAINMAKRFITNVKDELEAITIPPERKAKIYNLNNASIVKETNYSITAVLKTNRSDKEGKHPLSLRIEHQGKIKFKRTGISLFADQWDEDQVINHPHWDVYNDIIRVKINDLKTELGDTVN